MSKLLVVNPTKDSKVPFLRGMLTGSLQDAGLEFADAYQLATEIRDEFDEAGQVTTDELRTRIEALLADAHPGKVLRSYRTDEVNLQVVYRDGHRTPFSRGIHARRLESCSLPRKRCNAIARIVHGVLVRNKKTDISTAELTALTYRTVLKELGEQYADYYLLWNDFIDTHQPLLVLIGGVPGTGKSTVATELANRLGVVRTQSTDMLREVMRTLIPERLSPLLHTSSYNAGETLDAGELYGMQKGGSLLQGFHRQVELVELACCAVLQRAVDERVSVILEGVHIRPSLLHHLSTDDAVIAPFMLGVLDKPTLVSHIKRRKTETEALRAARYLEKIDDIWQLQSALLSEADNADIQILNNLASENTVREMIKTIAQTVAATYSPAQRKKIKSQLKKTRLR